jgi:hypothetical protein
MLRKFLLNPDQYDTPKIDALRNEWRNIPDAQARNVIAVESQYLAFHYYLIGSLRHQAVDSGDVIPIGLSVRVGALKTATLLCVSITGAALRAHAEARNYNLPADPYRRTFGKVLEAWQLPGNIPRPDVIPIWDRLQRLHGGRNTVHLYAAIQARGTFNDILLAESRLLAEAEAVLAHLRNLVTR